jgi:hypothetical protein
MEKSPGQCEQVIKYKVDMTLEQQKIVKDYLIWFTFQECSKSKQSFDFFIFYFL